MKKALSLILALCVVFSALSLTAAAAAKDRAATDAFYAGKLFYDINCDGAVTTDDVRAALCAAAGAVEAPEEVSLDVDGDGAVTTLDALKILKVKTGIDTSWYTEKDIITYLTSELNWVKTARPGFSKTTKEVPVSNTVTVTGMPEMEIDLGLIKLKVNLNADNMDYKEYLNKNKTLFSMVDGYDSMLEQADELYKTRTTEKTVAKANSSHYTFFPVNGKTYACKFDPDTVEYKSITFKEGTKGTATITLTMKDYSYPDGTYPAKALATIPYGQIFNLPALKDVESVDLKSGKVVCVIDTVTGGIKTVDYSYTYSATGSTDSVDMEDQEFTMTLNTTAKYSEHYDIEPIAA